MYPTADDLTRYLRDGIPLADFMKVEVSELTSESICLTAPFSANRNPHRTIFAGSQATLATLAGWALLYACLQQDKSQATLVLQQSQIQHQRPLKGAFQAQAKVSSSAIDRFLNVLRQQGRAQLQVDVCLKDSEGLGADWRGNFVALT